MGMRQVGATAGWLVLAVLLGVALWFRVGSLGTLPEPHADEAFSGVQAARLAAGRAGSALTPTGHLTNPFSLILQVPLIRAFGPQFWILRSAGLASGILAVVLAYVLGRRVLDGPSALVAATTFAVLPIAIVYSRDGCDYGMSPTFGLLTLLCAFGGRKFGLLGSFVAGLLVHPTSVFLGPIVLAVYLARVLPAEPSRARRVRLTAEALVGAAAVAGAVALAFGGGTGSRAFYAAFYKPPDWPEFVRGFGRYLSGVLLTRRGPIAESSLRLHDAAFWGLCLAVAVPGLRRLVLDRRWDRLALVGSLLASLAAFHVMTGPGVFSVAIHRYASGLIAPTALAFACLAREVLFTGPAGGTVRPRPVPIALGLAVAASALIGTKAHHFDPVERGSIWRLAGGNPGVFQRTYEHIRDEAIGGEADASGIPPSGARGVVVQDWWFWKPLEYLAASDPDLAVIPYGREGADAGRRLEGLRRILTSGGCAFGVRGQTVINHVEALFPPERLECWEAAPFYVVYRLRPETADGPATAEAPDPTRLVGADHSSTVIR